MVTEYESMMLGVRVAPQTKNKLVSLVQRHVQHTHLMLYRINKRMWRSVIQYVQPRPVNEPAMDKHNLTMINDPTGTFIINVRHAAVGCTAGTGISYP